MRINFLKCYEYRTNIVNGFFYWFDWYIGHTLAKLWQSEFSLDVKKFDFVNIHDKYSHPFARFRIYKGRP